MTNISKICKYCNGTGRKIQVLDGVTYNDPCSVCKGTGSNDDAVIIAKVKADIKRDNAAFRQNTCPRCGDYKQDCECC